MEKKTSYAEFSSQLNDKNIVVIEFGRKYTRCGFASESAPRAIIKTCINHQGHQVYLHQIKDAKKLQTLLGEFVERIYFNYLAVSPKEKKVVIVESVFCRSIFRNTLTRVFFEQFNVPSILFVPDHLMALATLGRSTGLIVDLGEEEAISIAVINGVTLLNETQFTSLGAQSLDQVLADHLIKRSPEFQDLLKPEKVEDIRIKCCFVAPYSRIYEKNDVENGSPATIEYPLGGQKTITVPGSLREGACEILFEIVAHEQSLTTMIIDTILLAPIDCRQSLAENILVIGGLANLPGLEHRLSEELNKLVEYQRFKFKFHRSICPKNYVSWLGASMFCTPSSIELRSTTRDQWIRDGKKNIRDWSDLIR